MPWSLIEFQDPTGEILVARVPPEGTAEFISGSQLLVQEGQIAALFHDGKPTDGFRAGRYTLSTQNLPVLSKLLRLTTMSKSPFRSYVYFVAMKTFTDLGWGTSSPILFRDTELKMVNLRANGSFAVRVTRPSVFLRTMVGTQGKETTWAVEEYLRKIILSRFTQTLPKLLTTVLDLPQEYDRIAVAVKKAVYSDLDQYGLELVDMLVESITLPLEVQETINRAVGTRAVTGDEMSRYERIARSDALRDAAKQPGGEAAAGLAAGLGIGAGMGVAREMMTPIRTGGGDRERMPVEQIRGKLQELKDLLAEGLITQDDFDGEKKRLLSGI